MHTQNAMAGTSVAGGLTGFIAQLAPPLPAEDMPKFNMAMVAFAAIPMVTLFIRAGYCVLMRWLAHGEIMKMIELGQLSPTLAQKIVDDTSRISPESAAIHQAQGMRAPAFATYHIPTAPVPVPVPVNGAPMTDPLHHHQAGRAESWTDPHHVSAPPPPPHPGPTAARPEG